VASRGAIWPFCGLMRVAWNLFFYWAFLEHVGSALVVCWCRVCAGVSVA
jgi:hypothetical protein